MVDAAKQYIVDGDIFQVVLSQRFETPFNLPPSRSIARCAANPSPFLFYLELAGHAVLISPLSAQVPDVVRLRDGEVTIRQIAGTRPRGKNAEEDQANETSLINDPKELAEHLMLLDLGRNDVGRVSKLARSA